MLLQVSLGVLLGLRLAFDRPPSVAVMAALTYGGLLVAMWWAVGRWLSLVLVVDAAPIALAAIVHALGIDAGLGVIGVAPVVGASLVGLLAARLDRGFRTPLTGVDPADFPLPEAVAGQLTAAGFHDRADLACAYDGQASVVIAAYPHRTEPVYAQVIVRPRLARPVGGLVTLLSNGRVLETETRARFPGGPGRLRQVFRGADVGELTRRHLEALAWLHGRGVAALAAEPASYRVMVDELLDDGAAAVRAHPLRASARALVLMVRRASRDEGPLQERATLAAGLAPAGTAR